VTNTWTIERILAWTTDFFSSHQVESARLDAEVLLAHALGLGRIDLYIRQQQPLNEHERTIFRQLVLRRSQGVPVAYITGEKEFWSMPLMVDEGVLIPRPETEILIEQIISRVKSLYAGGNETLKLVFCDIGTGSGAIALSLAKEYPVSSVIATDCSARALDVARRNVVRYAEAGCSKVRLLHSSLATGIKTQSLDVLASNLPYIPLSEKKSLSKEVRCEPDLALFSGDDGLDLVRELLSPDHIRVLKPGGIIALELSSQQVEVVAQLLSDRGFQDVSSYKDLAGLDRGVIARRGRTP